MTDFIDVWIMRSPPKPTPKAEKLLAPLLHGYRNAVLSRTKLGRLEFIDDGKDERGLPGLDVSVSHSHKIWLAAFARGRRIGADIERVRPEFDFSAIVRDHFVASERDEWERSNRNIDVFFHVWTQKEAVTKALGLGLQMPLTDIEVEADPRAGCGLIKLNGRACPEWHLKALAIDPDYKSVLAIEGADATVNYKFYEKSLVPLSSAP
ncbi:MAG: 4'-phosphopantetheinyl transferase superfamily protein [Bdellovibrionia bacterium]